jgi:hypothetical protein
LLSAVIAVFAAKGAFMPERRSGLLNMPAGHIAVEPDEAHIRRAPLLKVLN